MLVPYITQLFFYLLDNEIVRRQKKSAERFIAFAMNNKNRKKELSRHKYLCDE